MLPPKILADPLSAEKAYFMFSEPTIGERFFGRQEILDLLNKRVWALKDGYRQNIALTGQSLAGKSYIILHFLHTIKEEGFVPVYVEVVRENFRSFSNKFIATMLYNSLVKAGEDVPVEMDALLERARDVFPKTSLAIKHVNSYSDHGQLDEAYMGLLGLTSVMKEESGQSCIVILDEFDNLELLGIKNPFLNFGKVIMVQKDTMYIVSSSRNRAIKKIITEKLSLLFGNFEVVRVANFDLRTSGEFIDMKLGGVDIEPPLKKFLITLTDGNPFYLDKIASRAKDLALERMSSYVDREVLGGAILDLVYNANGIIHQYLLNFILNLLDTRHRDNYISILVAIANGRNKQADIAHALKAKKTDISKGVDFLSELGLISKNGVFFRIDDAMLEFWLKYVYQRRKDLLVDGAFDKMALFAGDIRECLDHFLKELEKGVPQRLAELFNLFGNELVTIEAKNVRLPHFTRVEVRTFPDSKLYISCSFRGNVWIVQPYEHDITENDVINYIKNVKSSSLKVSNKVMISLKGIDENAKLLAKELKISVWDSSTANTLLNFYGEKRIAIL
ncbi:MAG: ATP-binding protein [Candidatus Omnitrophica bacterium]|nr:ATP-binding protein [Candidatus Omnitrophota bacterium]